MQLDLPQIARAAVEKDHGIGFDVVVDTAVAAVLAALPGEPVAWQVVFGVDNVEDAYDEAHADVLVAGAFQPGAYKRPLYASPRPAVTEEMVDAYKKAFDEYMAAWTKAPDKDASRHPGRDATRAGLEASLAAEGRGR